MRDVVLLGVRSEWVVGSEVEGLDNVRLTKASDAYWAWIGGYYAGSDLADENKAGKLAAPNGDGADNWSEFIAGTTPTNRWDVLRIESISTANASCLLDFNTHTGRLFGVESSAALSQSNLWNTVANEIPGTGLIITVSNPAAGISQFYRLKVRRNQ